jgi:hypothetical protein
LTIDKDHLKAFLKKQKVETLKKNKLLVESFIEDYADNFIMFCDLSKGKVDIKFCEDKEDKRRWTAYVHLTTSLPYRGAVGRQVKYFVMWSGTILGMVHLTSPLAQLKLRDEYIGSTGKDKWKSKILNKIYNVETCVAISSYSGYLTGKLLVYTIFSNEVKRYLKNKYKEDPIGFEITSLYGKSSLYNRIPFLKYLGLTDGNSAVYISDEDWKKILKEYYEVYPNTKTNRLAPVKFQIVDKLSAWYKKNNLEFPFEYNKQEFRRGVYFGYTRDCEDLEAMVNNWRRRWYLPRLRRLWVKKHECRE